MVPSATLRAMRRALGVVLFSLALAAPAPAGAAVSLVPVGTFASPTFVTAPPGDPSRVLVVERGGTVRLVRDGAVQARPFADLSARVLSGDERGLLSLAFAPDYATSGLLYVCFTNQNGALEVDELRRSSADPDVADAAYARAVIKVPHPDHPNHNGGQLEF